MLLYSPLQYSVHLFFVSSLPCMILPFLSFIILCVDVHLRFSCFISLYASVVLFSPIHLSNILHLPCSHFSVWLLAAFFTSLQSHLYSSSFCLVCCLCCFISLVFFTSLSVASVIHFFFGLSATGIIVSDASFLCYSVFVLAHLIPLSDPSCRFLFLLLFFPCMLSRLLVVAVLRYLVSAHVFFLSCLSFLVSVVSCTLLGCDLIICLHPGMFCSFSLQNIPGCRHIIQPLFY